MSSTKLLILALVAIGWFALPALGADDAAESGQTTAESAAPAVDAPTASPAESSEAELAPSAGAAQAIAVDADHSESVEVAGEAPDATLDPSADPVAADMSGDEAAEDVTGEIQARSSQLASDPTELEAAEVAEAEQAAEAVEDVAVGEADDLADVAESADAEGVDDDAMADVAPADEPSPDAIAELGEIGYDSQGRRGRIHVVRSGDTLWDISGAYLGTPWVWPSIWNDNDNISNPHRIEPGDRIWITPNEMRRVSAAEAAAMLANQPPDETPDDSLGLASTDPDAGEVSPVADAVPAPVEVPEERPKQRVSNRESAGLISAKQLKSAATIIDRIPQRVLLTQQDRVYIGLGESETEVGDQYLAFRTNEKVFDPDTGQLLGYHVEVVGWVEIVETYPETSLARIGMSMEGLEVGDSLIPRERLPLEIALQESPQNVEGKISFFPDKRVLLGLDDFVYINRGTEDGLAVGSPLEVYRPGHETTEPARSVRVAVPDHVIANLVVVRANTEASVAVVTKFETELKLGDRFRGLSQ